MSPNESQALEDNPGHDDEDVSVSLTTIFEVIKSGGVVAVLVVVTYMFLTGDVISRRVWEDLTHEVARQVVLELRPLIEAEIDRAVEDAVDKAFDDYFNDGSDSKKDWSRVSPPREEWPDPNPWEE